MSIIHRIRRRLGHDTTTTPTDDYPLYRYTVTHTNGETSTVEANGYKTSGAFAKFYTYETVYVASLMAWSVWPIGETNRVLDSIQEIEKQEIGRTRLEATIDMADGAVLDKEVWDE